MRITAKATAIILLATTGLVACGQDGDPPLVGTTWELVSLQVAPAGQQNVSDPAAYWLTFDKDDKAFFLFDCNRGKGGYTTKPSGDGSSGELSFGTIDTTTQRCAPASLDEQVIGALAGVRSYSYKDGELTLSLAGNSGSLRYRRA